MQRKSQWLHTIRNHQSTTKLLYLNHWVWCIYL